MEKSTNKMRKKIKVLQFPIKNTNGGITRSAIKYWEHIDHERFQFGFATCSKKLDFENEISEKGGVVHYLSCTAEEDEIRFCEEFSEILKQGYDVVHLNTPWWRSFNAEIVAKELGLKRVIVHARSCSVEGTSISIINQEKKRHEECKRMFDINLATDFLACSKEAADFLFGPQIDRSKIVIFHNAINLNKFKYDLHIRKSIRHELAIGNELVIGMVGRLTKIKNHEFGLACLSELLRRKINVKMIIVGDGELRDELQENVEKFDISDSVIFVGNVLDVEKYMNVMDVLLFPSLHEGLGNVLIEAQATGLKCLANVTIPLEAKVTSNVTFLELNTTLWCNEIQRYVGGYDRVSMSEEIRKAGYDMEYEIKKLEMIYEGKFN